MLVLVNQKQMPSGKYLWKKNKGEKEQKGRMGRLQIKRTMFKMLRLRKVRRTN